MKTETTEYKLNIAINVITGGFLANVSVGRECAVWIFEFSARLEVYAAFEVVIRFILCPAPKRGITSVEPVRIQRKVGKIVQS